MRQRGLRLLKWHVIMLAAGLLYAFFMHRTGIGIPCIVKSTTGFRCPGCGISHMCLALLQGQIKTAFSCNRGVMSLLPVLFLLWIRYVYRYLRYGSVRLQRLDQVLLFLSIVVLVGWGILRNLPAFMFLN